MISVICKPGSVLETLPVTASEKQAGSLLWESVWRKLGMIWCRKFHQKHYQRTTLDESRAKVRCECCGRKFIREKHKGYLVG